ncbi:Proteolipid membrane putative modulator family protein [Candida parapsilosis]|nr:Proteolipid membrane putative modulator family protein [Candida parapsilosis]KAF6064277.1 Proteolipid membrane putative modulator family protein [Candida parapsilosis]
MCICLSDLLLIVLSVFFPPLPVWIRRGVCSKDSAINILLCILGFIPGLIHAWYIIAKYPPYYHQSESKVYYVYRNDLENQTPRDHPQHPHHHHHNHHNHQQHNQAQNGHIADEPSPQPAFGHGSVVEGGSNGSTAKADQYRESAPPLYSEVDNKVQH